MTNTIFAKFCNDGKLVDKKTFQKPDIDMVRGQTNAAPQKAPRNGAQNRSGPRSRARRRRSPSSTGSRCSPSSPRRRASPRPSCRTRSSPMPRSRTLAPSARAASTTTRTLGPAWRSRAAPTIRSRPASRTTSTATTPSASAASERPDGPRAADEEPRRRTSAPGPFARRHQPAPVARPANVKVLYCRTCRPSGRRGSTRFNDYRRLQESLQQVFRFATSIMLLMATFFGFGLRSCGAFASPLRTAARGGARMASTVVEGEVGTESYRQFFTDASGAKISPWHDISLAPAGAEKDVFNMLTEIPKYGLAKMEVDTKGASNPIMQDTKKGKLRFYHGPIFWNYGCLPQTWEDPNAEHPVLKCFGDNDPIDVVEIGSSALEAGSVTPVRALGVLAMIDDGELDWKVLAIALDDPLAKELFTVADVEAKCPGVVSGVREWFRWYKTPDGKPINAFGFDEEMLPKEKALEVIEETHAAWKGLRAGTIDAGKLWKGN